jgi:ComF family protein
MSLHHPVRDAHDAADAGVAGPVHHSVRDVQRDAAGEAAAGPVSRMALVLRGALAACADLVVPPCCLVCRTRMGAHHLLCAKCWREVRFIRPPVCDVLGIPLPFDAGERMVSAAALAAPPAWDRARAVAHFSGAMRTLVHQLKYADRHDARTLFARWLAAAARDLGHGPDLIVPVPLARLKLLARHFNQAAVLAAALAPELGVPMEPMLLRRTRWTRSQVGMTRAERQRNIAGAFSVAPRLRARIEGRNVLLVDDVITTGATANACARVLKRAGAARVDVVALALVTNEALAMA